MGIPRIPIDGVESCSEKIPVVGTGGTSTSNARALGANVISASGTTGTTNRSRAVGYISALAAEWKLKYSAVIGKTTEVDTSNIWKRINLRSIMMSSLPGFIAMALILAVGKIPFLSESIGPLFDKLVVALPVIVAIVAAKQIQVWMKLVLLQALLLVSCLSRRYPRWNYRWYSSWYFL